jgi:FtsP/CotA-like multicopper oxidase with cupredoxin domain
MISSVVRARRLLTVLIVTSSFCCAAHGLGAISANDNRSPAGELKNNVLTIRLELGEGQWHPESEDGEAFDVYVFGEAGRPLQNPGPLIRVSQGTEIHAIVHNALRVAATVHGLHERPGNAGDALFLQPDATQEVRFRAGTQGTYYYWATTTSSTLEGRAPIDTQLAGAFVIDPPDIDPAGAVANDRVFVIGLWHKGVPLRPGSPQLATINGKSWPYTERFTFQLGETVHWRWLNLSVLEHAMHLHGFYYHLDGIGDGEHHQAYTQAERPMIVTRLVESGQTFDMTWVPDRSGRWLFHCHMFIHMSPPEWRVASAQPGTSYGAPSAPAVALKPAAVAATDQDHRHGELAEHDGMGGLVLGITVEDKKGSSNAAVWHAERKLQLTINERKDGGRPCYNLEVRQDVRHPAVHDPDVRDQVQPPSSPPAAAPPPLLGPPILLTRGQPVEIEVVNRSTQPTAIHWHGIELESYYDGVPSWTGTAQQTTPAIQPGESFVARMAPPRAGTFIYHTHWHDRAQLENGIYGPLIVLPSGQVFDPAFDKIFLFSVGSFEPFGNMALINGRPQPLPLQLVTATKYRFRLINITPNAAHMRVSLRRAGTPVQWRIIAKDGADLPSPAATVQSADLPITVGETYDFEYEATDPQELALEIYLPGVKTRATQALVFAAARPSE